jgi:putative SOS response-associated peptidase YedK
LREAGKIFNAALVEADVKPSFNIAPRQPVAVIMEEGKRKIVSMQWGLIPHWAKDPKIGYKMINARMETITEKPSYREAFKKRRCLIIADGFYEWRTGPDGKKEPVYIYLKNKKTFGIAGIYEIWKSSAGEQIISCSIITTQANEIMKPIHVRMPVIIDPKDYDEWLNTENNETEKLSELLKPFASENMQNHLVSNAVNVPYHNAEDCIAPIKMPVP